MGNLNFDNNGNLFPYEVIEISKYEFEDELIFSGRRAKIYVEFKQLILELRVTGISFLYVWIDGSFASLKANPGDMDVVFFIDYKIYNTNESRLIDLKKNYSLLDIYFIKSYPKEHSNYFLTNFDKLDWLHFFTKDRHNNKKGILKLVLSHETI